MPRPRDESFVAKTRALFGLEGYTRLGLCIYRSLDSGRVEFTKKSKIAFRVAQVWKRDFIQKRVFCFNTRA